MRRKESVSKYVIHLMPLTIRASPSAGARPGAALSETETEVPAVVRTLQRLGCVEDVELWLL